MDRTGMIQARKQRNHRRNGRHSCSLAKLRAVPAERGIIHGVGLEIPDSVRLPLDALFPQAVPPVNFIRSCSVLFMWVTIPIVTRLVTIGMVTHGQPSP